MTVVEEGVLEPSPLDIRRCLTVLKCFFKGLALEVDILELTTSVEPKGSSSF